MQLEVGKFYKTRDGEKVEILAQREGVFIGWSDGYLGVQTWKASGQNLSGTFMVDDWDIIEAWEERVVLEGWINVYPSGLGEPHSTRQDAVKRGDKTRMGCLYIKVDLSKPKGQRIWEEV